MRRFLTAIVGLVLLVLFPDFGRTAAGPTEVSASQAPKPGNYSAAQFTIQQSFGNMVPMRDGVRLSVDIYRPEGSGRYPAVLTITPYDNNSSFVRDRAKWFAQRGYVAVVADTRGRFDSEGVWDPFNAIQKSDGYDLVEWIAKQDWCTGGVGMYGPSYQGFETWWTATQAPPSLKAIVPEVTPPDQFESTPYQNGVLTGSYMPDWAALMSGRTFQLVGDGPYGGWPARRHEDFKHTPYSDINRYRGMQSGPWALEWYRHNKSSDPYWQAISYQSPENYSKITTPSLAVTGWFDPSQPGTPMNYIGMKQYGATPEARHPHIVIGPWTHGPVGTRQLAGIDYGPDAALDWDGYVTRWFDHFLKGIDNGVENDPPVHVFVMGANKWRAESDWPLPRTRWVKYYLQSGGRANSLKGDGLLSPTPARQDMPDTYIYDPRNPTQDPYRNGSVDGAVDTRLSALGDEVLVYQTPPLQSALEVTGPIEATLYAATSARDTDWFVRLVDVDPDGRSLLLAEGAMRARNRDPSHEGRFNSAQLTDIEPGKVYEYTIKFWRTTANLFGLKHRVRVEISSSWYPYFLPNLNTGAENLATVSIAESVVAHQSIHHGVRFPSHILLPVIPSEK